MHKEELRNLCSFLHVSVWLIVEGFQILTEVSVRTTVYWDVTPNILVAEYQHFRGICCFHLQGKGSSSRKLLGVSSENNLIKEDSVTSMQFHIIYKALYRNILPYLVKYMQNVSKMCGQVLDTNFSHQNKEIVHMDVCV